MPNYINLLVEFLALNPQPSDKQVHSLADAIGVDKETLETQIYAITAELLSAQGVLPAEETPEVIPTLEVPEGL